MKKLIILSIFALIFPAFSQVPPPVLRNMFSTNEPNTPVLGKFQLNTRSNEAAVVINTNWMVITNSRVGIGTNAPDANVTLNCGNATNNPVGTGGVPITTLNVVGQSGGNGLTGGGASPVTSINIKGSAGGIGTNSGGGSGGGITISAGAGGIGNLAGGVGGRLTLSGASGGNGSNSGGGGGLFVLNAGSGGNAITNNGGAGGNATINAGLGGDSQMGNGGNGGSFSATSGEGRNGNITGGNGGALAFTANQGGFGTNSGGNGGTMTFSGGSGGNANTNTGGTGSSINFNSGNGGNSVFGFGGYSGNINFTGGNGGTGVTNGNGGSIYLKPGTGSTNGNVFLGINSAGDASGSVFVFATTNFNTTNAAPIITNVPAGPTPIGLFGQMVFFGATNTLALSGSTADYTNFSAFFRVSTNVFNVNTNIGFLTNLVAGWYRVAYMVDVIPVADNNGDELEVEIFCNANRSEVGASVATMQTGIQISLVDSSILYLPERTGISLRFRNLSDATSSIDIRHCTVSIGSP